MAKLDADDQEEIFQAKSKKIKDALEKSTAPTPKWEQSPAEIGNEIASNFYQVTSLFHADLRRQIRDVIEAEREVAKHYMTQMGR